MNTSCEFWTGPAGSGKTTAVRKMIEQDPTSALLCATTGIAAVNLDAVTINSVFGYYDTDSLTDAYISGQIARKYRGIAKDYKAIAVDEVSMLGKSPLDTHVMAISEVNDELERKTGDDPFEDGDEDDTPIARNKLGIILTGDFAQLPPIKEDWAFHAECWPEFDKGVKKFDKIHRQSNPEFMEALQHLRHGEGGNASDLLEKLGADFHIAIKHDFDGTTIMAKNDKVGRFNVVALSKLPGQKIVFQTVRAGQLRSEWKHIPEQQEFKIGALVMMLTNKHMGGEMVYANGEEGHILDYRPDGSYLVQLLRGNSIVNVEPLVRNNEVRELPKYMKNDPVVMSQVWRNEKTKRWVIGSITYMPMRLAYATTCHKSQGLSLDRVQVDIRDGFFGKPNMLYVALSRARNPEGLRIVGSKDQFVKRCKIAEEVRRWL